jgi:hypothetical protein
METDFPGGILSIKLSTNLDDPSATPYFLWDDPMTVQQLKDRLKSYTLAERTRLLAKVLREARDTDVWRFTSPQEVWQRRLDLYKYLGRRRAFWEFLLDRWHKEGLIGG